MKFAPYALTAAAVLAQSALAQDTLKSLAAAKGIYIGAACDNGEIVDPTFAKIIGEQFHTTTPGNGMKWDATEPSQGTFSYSKGDEILNFAKARNMTVRGHTLVWHSQLPSWVSTGTWTKDTLTAAIQSHVTNLVTHYKGQLLHWDVVNEVFNEDGTWRSSVFYNTLGEDFVAIAFRAARAADPDVKLYINDYNLDYAGAKANAMYNLVKKLKADGVPIDGVGSQSHLIVGGVPAADLEVNLKKFTSLGVEVALTEVDIRGSTPLSSADLQQQKSDYQATFGACLNTPGCVGVTIWGFTDRYSWIPTTFPGEGDALPWDKNYNRKPAHDGIVLALGGTPAPTTTTTGTPTPTPTGEVDIHVGSGLEPGWQNWSWNMAELNTFWPGPPTPVVGQYAIKAVTGEYGGLNLKGTEAAFANKTIFSFYIAGQNPNYSVRFESSAETYTSDLQPLAKICPDAISVDAFTHCQVDLTTLGTHKWDLVAFMSHNAVNQTLYLSDVYLAESAGTSPTTTTAAPTTTQTSGCGDVTITLDPQTITVPGAVTTLTETVAPTTTTTTTRSPLPTQSADSVVYDGTLQSSWQNWSWNTVIDFANKDLPGVNGQSAVLKGNATAYGGLSLKGSAFGGYKALIFSVAADKPNWSIRLDVGSTEGSVVKLETFCPGSITVTAFTQCKVDLDGFNNYDRVSFMSHTTGEQDIYLSNIYLSAVSMLESFWIVFCNVWKSA
ncbi:hypothetical protein HDV00_010441 [Rhizophlyctis rosea]|nr:hypothetical protein HDV00_010441 [Rhizophlyctis rosea]